MTASQTLADILKKPSLTEPDALAIWRTAIQSDGVAANDFEAAATLLRLTVTDLRHDRALVAEAANIEREIIESERVTDEQTSQVAELQKNMRPLKIELDKLVEAASRLQIQIDGAGNRRTSLRVKLVNLKRDGRVFGR